MTMTMAMTMAMASLCVHIVSYPPTLSHYAMQHIMLRSTLALASVLGLNILQCVSHRHFDLFIHFVAISALACVPRTSFDLD